MKSTAYILFLVILLAGCTRSTVSNQNISGVDLAVVEKGDSIKSKLLNQIKCHRLDRATVQRKQCGFGNILLLASPPSSKNTN